MKLPTLDARRLRTTVSRSFGMADGDDPDEEWEYAEIAGTPVGPDLHDDGYEYEDEYEYEYSYVPVDDDLEDEVEVEPVPPPARRRGRWRGDGVRRHREALVDDDLDTPVAVLDDDGYEELGDEDEVEVDDDDLGVDPRIAARRDSVAQARRDRLRRRLIAVGVVVAVILAVGGYTRSAGLDVDQVLVTGAQRSDPAELRTASGIVAGAPLVGLDLDQARAGVLAEPWILDATVERAWSGAVTISVVERTPVATVNAGDGGWLQIDGDRRVVAAGATPPDLPLVDGIGTGSVGEQLTPDAAPALAVAAGLTPSLRSRVAVVHGADPDAIELALQPTGTVRFGPATAIDERVRSLHTVFAKVDLLCLATIDLRVPDAPVLTRIPSCA